MPTPIFTIRLAPKTQEDLASMSKVYGSPNPRAFAREVLEVMCSGDLARVKDFNARLIRGVGEQLTLKLNAAADTIAATSRKPVQKPKKRLTRTKTPPRR